jgi:putative hydrolase of the HAD superfamily
LLKTIFIDFDGVIRHWSNAEISSTEENLGLPLGCFYSVAFQQHLLLPAITGQVSHEQWVTNVENELAEKYSILFANKLIASWESTPSTIDYDFIDRIRTMVPQAKLVLVTNATSKLTVDLALANLTNSFDIVINSSVIGVAKPNLDFFEKSLSLTQSKIEDSVFIDDSASNVEAAKKIGLASIYHRNPVETLAFIQQYCQ